MTQPDLHAAMAARPTVAEAATEPADEVLAGDAFQSLTNASAQTLAVVPGRALTEATDPYCLRPGEAATLLAGHPWHRFAVLGDSIAEGVADTLPGYSPLPLADRVAAELAHVRPCLRYLNLGRRGLRAHEVRERQLASALAFGPDLALVACGANDALRPGYSARADAVDAELGAIIRALQSRGALVVTVSIFVRPAYPSLPTWLRPTGTERMAALGARTTALAKELGTVHVDLARHPIAAAMDSTSADGLHGNARAQSVAAAETIRALGPTPYPEEH